MRTGHLFAGAGGGLLADLILGHEPVFAVEWDAYCCAVLRQRSAGGWFPGLRVHEGDVRLFDPSDYAGRVDCIHAGFPCQDISTAGSGRGIEGARSGLWSEVARVVAAVRPRWVFLENSPAIASRGLVVVLSDLAAMGFDARWLVLPASAVGAPHLRARWFCLAADARASRSVTDFDDQWELQQARREQAQREWVGDSAWWSAEPDVDRVVYGSPAAVDRITAQGNAEVPLQAAAAYLLLREGWS